MFEATKFQLHQRVYPSLTRVEAAMSSAWESEKARSKNDAQHIAALSKSTLILAVVAVATGIVFFSVAVVAICVWLAGSMSLLGLLHNLAGASVILAIATVALIFAAKKSSQEIVKQGKRTQKRWEFWIETAEELIRETTNNFTAGRGTGTYQDPAASTNGAEPRHH